MLSWSKTYTHTYSISIKFSRKNATKYETDIGERKTPPYTVINFQTAVKFSQVL